MKEKEVETKNVALSVKNQSEEHIPVHADADRNDEKQIYDKHVVRVDFERSATILDFNPIYPYYKAEPIIKISLNEMRKDKHGKNSKI
ncbi:hypothetical protein THOM_0893 [Trachipleistophora hominis]|uniref:Uncharacterized protein n=1 Tax=Trachipleistophora hominis TaxID=72359 RepID=L7JZE8_TRAHO|nr:hypothetical protein THOM_0893 [Trachipleistophora hominis]